MKLPKHTNSIIYIISLLIPVVLTAILGLIQLIPVAAALSKGESQNAKMMFIMMAVGLLIYFIIFMLIPLITYSILYLIQIYRIWEVINDGKTRMTPGKAIGYLFIPFYNLYWIFQVWGGFPADYNAYLNRYGLNQKVLYLKEGLFQFFPILILFNFIIGIPVLLIVFAVLLNRTNIAIDNLKFAVAEIRNQLPQQPIQKTVFQPQANFSS